MTRIVLIAILMSMSSLQVLIDSRRWSEAEARLGTVAAQLRPRYEGLIAEGRGQPTKAAAAFERALQATPGVPELHLHAAHTYLQLKRYDQALRHAQAAASLRDKALVQPMLTARALQGLSRDAEAFAVLQRACATFPDQYRPWLELAVLAHRYKLSHESRRAARGVMASKPGRDVILSLFELLRDDRRGLPLLEEVVAAHPRDAELRAQLAHVYAAQRQCFSAARLFEDATLMGGPYAFEAADQYRMAGRFRDALRMNDRVAASERQRVQRLAIVFEQKHYARIVAMKLQVNDLGSRYRVAYAHYAVGDFAGARSKASALLKTAYRQEAGALLEAMATTAHGGDHAGRQ